MILSTRCMKCSLWETKGAIAVSISLTSPRIYAKACLATQHCATFSLIVGLNFLYNSRLFSLAVIQKKPCRKINLHAVARLAVRGSSGPADRCGRVAE
ncbi:hypothetical protein FJU30_05110 [Affinibrenneria salicis]|uniref:Uncharacterized protein n=1 Tax=Affinibrenneria salicis TaxID=2590031 RepID=A0A5J5G487_9GAMM|nr:hypothetical protein [Affinibrenneria salicis]KAA9001674.1 hypothetical protein FJU30_05110 [Affinibrenneria salicis]